MRLTSPDLAIHRFARRYQKQRRKQTFIVPAHRPRKRKFSLDGDGISRRNKRVRENSDDDYSRASASNNDS